MNQPSNTRYDALSRAFHWLAAIVVSIAFVLAPEHFGRLMRDGVDPATRYDIVWHETLGILVFGLTLVRLLWMAFRPAAPQIPMAPWMHMLGKLMHLALWVLMLALPITAILALGGEGYPLTLLGGFRLDQMPLVANSAIVKLADWGDVHGFLGDAILSLAGLHAAAAIYHHVVRKDGVLLTMMPQKDSL